MPGGTGFKDYLHLDAKLKSDIASEKAENQEEMLDDNAQENGEISVEE